MLIVIFFDLMSYEILLQICRLLNFQLSQLFGLNVLFLKYEFSSQYQKSQFSNFAKINRECQRRT